MDRRRRARCGRSSKRLAARLGIADRVRFLGWREDVPRLLARADLLVCPSLHEPLGNVVIEAWSAGLPVVATASDGPAGLIEDGVSGILVPLPDSPAAAHRRSPAAIERVCDDPRIARPTGEAGRRPTKPSSPRRSSSPRYRQFFDRIAA